MFNAQAAAYRSASLGRQVGAVIARQDGSIVASGTNEVPKAGGGTYWQEDTFDRRDHVRGRDSSDEMRYELLGDIMDRLQRNGWIHPDKEHTKINEMVRDLLEGDPPVMKGAVFASLTEFQRPVHAEMSALTDAARNGTATGGCSIFVTTFPCHGCTRHIIASGIKRVVYIEPYAKSLALHMHEDAIEVDKDHYNETKVHFEPFVGLAPRRYLELFVMIKRKENNGELVKWDPAIAVPRLGGWSHLLTIENENTLIVKSREALQKAGLE
jgi:cytidine deaminase